MLKHWEKDFKWLALILWKGERFYLTSFNRLSFRNAPIPFSLLLKFEKHWSTWVGKEYNQQIYISRLSRRLQLYRFFIKNKRCQSFPYFWSLFHTLDLLVFSFLFRIITRIFKLNSTHPSSYNRILQYIWVWFWKRQYSQLSIQTQKSSFLHTVFACLSS